MERNYPNISVTDKAARSLRGGHPWVYAGEVLQDRKPKKEGGRK